MDPRNLQVEETANRAGLPTTRPKTRFLVNLFWAAVTAVVCLLWLFDVSGAAPLNQNTATCTVQANRLNLRAGPATNYRSDGLLDKGTRLRATGRNGASTWIKVTVTSTNKQGWVAYGPQLATCTGTISRLPVATAPPATGANAATPNSGSGGTPLPSALALVVLPTGGGGANDLQGDLITNQSDAQFVRNPFASGPNDPDSPDYIRFTNRLGLALDITRRPPAGPLTRVDIYLTDNATGDIVYNLTIENAEDLSVDPICFFGGAPSNCNSIDLRAGALWPSGDPIGNGQYDLQMSAENTPTDEDGDYSSRNWFGTILIESPRIGGASSATPTPPPPAAISDPVIDFIETAPGESGTEIYDALTFQVEVWDPDVGAENGDGIEYVYMDISDSNGDRLLWRDYFAPPYCIFGQDGDEGCFTWWFGDHDWQWPFGGDIDPGVYTLYVNAVAVDGSESESTLDVVVQ